MARFPVRRRAGVEYPGRPRRFHPAILPPVFERRGPAHSAGFDGIRRTADTSNKWSAIYFAAKPIFPFGVQGTYARQVLRRLDKIRGVFAFHSGRRQEDPLRVLPYWLFAVDTIRHAARKLAIMGQEETNTPAARRALVNEMKALRKRFRHLWLARNRVSEIRIALKAYQKAIQAIRANALTVRPRPGRGYSTCVRLSRALPGAGKLHDLKYPADRKPLGFKKREFGAAEGDNMLYDLHFDIFNCAPRDVLVFFACPFHCPKSMKLDMGLGYDGPLKVWIDGQQVYHDPEGTNPANPDKAIIPIDAAAGKHEALIAMGSNHGKAWGLFFRVRPRAGRLSVLFPQDGKIGQT